MGERIVKILVACRFTVSQEDSGVQDLNLNVNKKNSNQISIKFIIQKIMIQQIFKVLCLCKF